MHFEKRNRFALLLAAASVAGGRLALGQQGQFQILDLGTLATDPLPINPSATVNLGGDINIFGQVSGFANDKQGDPSFAFRTEPNSPINPLTDNLGTLGGTSSTGNAVGPTGIALGSSSTGTNTTPTNETLAFRTAPNGSITFSSSMGAIYPGT